MVLSTFSGVVTNDPVKQEWRISAMMGFMPDVLIGTAAECLKLVPEPASGTPDSLVATLDLDGLSVTRSVVHNYASGFHDLAEFFVGLADRGAVGRAPAPRTLLKVTSRSRHGTSMGTSG